MQKKLQWSILSPLSDTDLALPTGDADSLHTMAMEPVVEADIENYPSDNTEATPASGACILQVVEPIVEAELEVVELEVEADHDAPSSEDMEATPDPGALVEPNLNTISPTFPL